MNKKIMRRKFLSIVSAAAMTAAAVPAQFALIPSAETTSPDMFSYYETSRWDSELGEYVKDSCKITGLTNPDIEDLNIPSEINGLKVTGIGYSAFENNDTLKSVIIPDTVTEIGNLAFYDCDSLESVVISDNLTYIDSNVFNNCSSLESVTLPANLESIYWGAFAHCPSLKSITLPDTLVSIGEDSFAYCYALENLKLPESISYIGDGAFYGTPWQAENPLIILSDGSLLYVDESVTELDIPDTVNYIGRGALHNCRKLERVNIPDSVKSIDSYAFWGCKSLKSVDIPSSVAFIGNYAFENCNSLEAINVDPGCPNNSSLDGVLFDKEQTELLCYPIAKPDEEYTIPDTVTRIQGEAFAGPSYNTAASKLKKVTVPESVTDLGNAVFRNSQSLETVVLPDTLKTLGGYQTFTNCTSLKNINIPAGVTMIPYECFWSCTSLEEITIPDGVKWIEDWAFQHCPSLRSIELPDSVVSLGTGVFAECSSLESVVLPDGVPQTDDSSSSTVMTSAYPTKYTGITSISKVFSGCSSLKSFNIPASLQYLKPEDFEGCTSLEKFTISEGNTYFEVFDDAVYKKLSKTSNPDEYDYTLILYPKGKVTDEVSFPEGLTVIGNGSFKDCTGVKSISVPEGVTQLDMNAFYGCTSLEKVSIPSSITDYKKTDYYESYNGLIYYSTGGSFSPTQPYGSAGFENCPALKEINVSEENEMLSSVDGVLMNKDQTMIFRYPSGREETTYAIPSTVNKLARESFCGSQNLVTADIPTQVTWIYPYAFDECPKLEAYNVAEDNIAYSSIDGVLYNQPKTSILAYPFGKKDENFILPDSVTEIPTWTFTGNEYIKSLTVPENALIQPGGTDAPNLENIYISENNQRYSSIDGVVFSKDKTKLLIYPYGRKASSYTIPDGVVEIGDEAFIGENGLTDLTIPDSVDIISYGAFGHDAYGNVIPGFTVRTMGLPTVGRRYAVKNDLEVDDTSDAQLGDVNGDTNVDSSDAALILQHYASVQGSNGGTLSAAGKAVADYNKDTTIDSSDAALILQYYAAKQGGR